MQQAVLLNLIVIGEATTKLFKDHADFLEQYTDVPWKNTRGMRNLNANHQIPHHTRFMRIALAAAQQARVQGEVPVGAVVICNGKIVATGANQPIRTHDPSAHAEMVALRAAARTLCNYRLPDCELYVTLEPCLMCAGAIIHARLARVVFGARDPKTGACGSVINAFANAQLNHHTQVIGGVLDTDCAQCLIDFFSAKRRA